MFCVAAGPRGRLRKANVKLGHCSMHDPLAYLLRTGRILAYDWIVRAALLCWCKSILSDQPLTCLQCAGMFQQSWTLLLILKVTIKHLKGLQTFLSQWCGITRLSFSNVLWPHCGANSR